MDRIEHLRPYDRMLTEYRTFCEKRKKLIERCIDLAVNTNLGKLVCGLDEREPEEMGLRFKYERLEIISVSPPGSISYVLVNNSVLAIPRL